MGAFSMDVGEVRAATGADFESFKHLAESEEGWQQRYNKNGTRVFTKLSDESRVKIIKVVSDLNDISMNSLFDVLLDCPYRSTWDDHMVEGDDLYKIDHNNDIGYYAVKMPSPLKNRDFLTQRSWRLEENEFMIFNRSVQHKDRPPRKRFVRGLSMISGFMVQKKADIGCHLTFISQSDPKGRLPKWLVNRVSTRIAPKFLDKLRKATNDYASWKSKNDPLCKPWLYPEQNNLPLLNFDDLISAQTANEYDVAEEDEIDESALEEGD